MKMITRLLCALFFSIAIPNAAIVVVESTPGNNVVIGLESFATSGYLASGSHCDPMWFTGLDKCDISLSICVEPNQRRTAGMNCSTPWIQLGQLTPNMNTIKFGFGTVYGAWNNPMTFPLPSGTWLGFTVKIMAIDTDFGSRSQLIDSWSYQFTTAANSLCPNRTASGNVITYQHSRPGVPTCGSTPNCPTSLTLAWTSSNCGPSPTGPPVNPSSTPAAPTMSTPAPPPNPCLHGGQLLRNNTCNCAKTTYWTGVNCSMIACQNGGSRNASSNTCSCTSAWTGPFCTTNVFRNCHDVYNANRLNPDGVYNLTTSAGIVAAYCDIGNGGFTVVQQRLGADNGGNFNQSWTVYENGFGTVSGSNSYWLGNKWIYALSTDVPMKLKVSVRECGDNSTNPPSIIYGQFNLGSSATNYTLHVTSNKSLIVDKGARDTFNEQIFASTPNGQQFSTQDRNNAPVSPPNCPANNGGGWWFAAACQSPLNSQYHANCVAPAFLGIQWRELNSATTYSMAYAQLALIPQ